jgi:hypothetical protein
VTYELVEQARGGVWQATVHVEPLAAVLQVLVALVALERQRNLDFGGFLQALDEWDAAEGRGEVDVEFNAVGAVWVVPGRCGEHDKRVRLRGGADT